MGAHPPAMGAHPPVLWRGLLALPLLLLLSPGSSQVLKLENGLEGGTIQLKPTFVGEVEGFTWKKGENKVVEVDFPGVPTYFGPAEKRSLDIKTGVLDIRDLTIQDEGRYKAEVLIDSKYTYSHFELRVFPALSQPHVECNTTNGNVTARCHLDEKYSKSLRYRWDTKQAYILSDNNKTLTVINATRDSMDSIECVVENPATQSSSSVSLKTCFPEEGNGIWVPIIIVLVILLIILLLIIICLWKYGLLKCCPWLQNRLNPICTQLNGQNEAGPQEQNGGEYLPVPTMANEPTDDQSTTENKASEKEIKEDRGPAHKDSRTSLEHQESADQINKTAEEGTTEEQEELLNETKSPSGHQQSQESLEGPSTYKKEPTAKDPTVNKEEICTGSSRTAETQHVEE